MMSLSHISQGDFAEAIGKGARASGAHAPYGTDTTQLAFGRKADGRLAHVSGVARGKSCNCVCPACEETLIARQGRKLAWHFAHASGHSCRNAVAAAFASFLAQIIEDGQEIFLPDLEWSWGSSRQLRAVPATTLCDARVVRTGASGFGVVAQSSADPARRLTLHVQTDRYRPTVPDNPEDKTSHLLIDLSRALAEWTEASPGTVPSESWISRQLGRDGSRRWLRNVAADALYEAMAEDRLGAHVAAFHAMDRSIAPHPCEEEIRIIGLSDMIDAPYLAGEEFLGPSSSGWRAVILRYAVLAPLFSGKTEHPVAEAGIAQLDLIRLIAREGLARSPALLRPLPADDALELTDRVPGLRKPIAVLEDYLGQLHSQGWVLAGSRALRRIGHTGRGDLRLDVAGKDWMVSPELIQRIRTR